MYTALIPNGAKMVTLWRNVLLVMCASSVIFQHARAFQQARAFQNAQTLEAPDVTCTPTGLVKIMTSPSSTARVVMAMTAGQPCGILQHNGGVLIDSRRIGEPVHVLLEHVEDAGTYDVIRVMCGGRARRSVIGSTAVSTKSWHGLPPDGGEARVDVQFAVGLKYANNSELAIKCDRSGVLTVSNPDPSSYKSTMSFNAYGDECNTKPSKSNSAVRITGCSLYKDIRISFGKRPDHGNIIGGHEMNRVYLINCVSVWESTGDKNYPDFEDLEELLNEPGYEELDEFNSATSVMVSFGMLMMSLVTASLLN